MGWECDDEAAYPRAKMAMVPHGKEVTEAFLLHREEIMKKVGAKLISNEPSTIKSLHSLFVFVVSQKRVTSPPSFSILSWL